MFRKMFAFALTLALVLTGSSFAVAAQASTTPVELTFWYCWTDKIQENNINLTNQFNDTVGKEKGIHVTAQYQGTYDDCHQKLQAGYVAGTMPDVSVMEIASIKTFAQNGVIEPLSPYIERDKVDMSDYFSGLLENCKVDDTWYGIPYLRSTPILYLNKTLLEKAGLDPAGPKDYNELATYCQTIKEKLGVYGLSLSCDTWMLEAFMFEAGTSILNDDQTKTNIASPEGIGALKFFKDLADKGYIRIVASADYATKVQADIMNQNCAMWLDSTADLTYNLSVAKENNFEINTTFIPKNVTYGVPTGGCNLVMASKIADDHKQAAWEFIKWMTDKDQTAYASSFTGYVATRKSALDTDTMKKTYEEKPQFKVALDQLNQYGHGRPMNPGYAEGQKLLTSLMESVWVNGGDVDKEAPATAEKVDVALAG
jgi:sn-glycerol 3-phosphate transport system substrate-binding protein